MTLQTPLIGPSAAGPGRAAAVLEAASDAELVVRARRGEREAAELLAVRCRRPAYLLALQLLREPEDALDVAQDALLSLFSTLDRVGAGRPVRPWLFAIVRNRARDLLRRRRVRRHQPLAAEDPEAGVELVATAPRPDADAERAELQRRVWRALAALPPAHREVLVLRDYQDLAYDEIAGVLRVPIGTVMSRLHRARRALRERLVAGGAAADGGTTHA
jgi:RNA polymerase sigma-70 factor (ECF subfamily)